MSQTAFIKMIKKEDAQLDVRELKYWLDIFYRGFKNLFKDQLSYDMKYICPTCGDDMEWNKTVRESSPPQFDYQCNGCGAIEILNSAKHEILEEFKPD